MAVKNMAASVLARLLNQSKEEGLTNQMCLQLFVQEEFLRRLSQSPYRDNMILKGGMFIYTLTEFDSRPTRDMDFMIRWISNDIENVQVPFSIDFGLDDVIVPEATVRKIKTRLEGFEVGRTDEDNFGQKNETSFETSLKQAQKQVLTETDYSKVLPIIEAIDEYGEVTPTEAERLCGKSRTTTWRYLSLLESSGFVKGNGNTNNSVYKRIC